MTRLPIAPMLPASLRAGRMYGQPVDLPLPAIPQYAPPDPMQLLAMRPRRQRAAPPDTITPEEERGLGSYAMGGVQWLGETLDKMGRASRGIIGGGLDLAQGRDPNWGGGPLNLIPFSDTMGLTDPEQQVTGWDLGDKIGMPANQPGMDRWDIPKFGLEVVTDPLFWATGLLGTMTRSGAAASKAAKAAQIAKLTKGLPKGIAEATGEVVKGAAKYTDDAAKGIAATPMGGVTAIPAAIEQMRRGDRAMFGFRAPKLKARLFPIGMTDEAVVSFGTGEWAAKATEALFYGGHGALGYALSPMRKLIQGYRGAFSKDVLEQFSSLGQHAADVGLAQTRMISDAGMEFAPIAGNLDSALRAKYAEEAVQHLGAGKGEKAYDEFMRMALDDPGWAAGQAPDYARLQEIAAKTLGVGKDQTLPQLIGAENELSKGISTLLDAFQMKTEIPAYRDLMDLGANVKLLDDIYVSHFGRRPGNFNVLREPGKDVSKAFFQFSLARQGPL